MAGVGGEGPEGLMKIYESLSIGFQVNRAIRIIEHNLKHGLFGGSVWGERSRLENRMSWSTGCWMVDNTKEAFHAKVRLVKTALLTLTELFLQLDFLLKEQQGVDPKT
jgi:hypothetical protein